MPKITPFTIAVAAFLGFAASSVISASASERCYPVATLKISFNVVFPEARQVTMDGSAAKTYLDAYNNFGNQTSYSGDSLFMNILPNGTTMIVPLASGKGCKRMIVGPRLHKMIMAKVARGAV